MIVDHDTMIVDRDTMVVDRDTMIVDHVVPIVLVSLYWSRLFDAFDCIQ